MAFLDSFKKDLEKLEIDVGSAAPPRYWFSTGSYVLNKILSGSFLRGIPQGRVVCYTGPSGSGKSFLVGNAIREAQKQGIGVFVIDSEHAFDDEFVTKIGADPTQGYGYSEAETIPQVQKIVSAFIKRYKADRGDDPASGEKMLIVIDSLDMLMTETEEDNFEKGVMKGDQGQRSKQLKALLRQFVQAIKHDNITILVTAQVYKNQDVLNGEGVWIVSDAIKFSLSHVALLTKLKLKNKATGQATGVTIKGEGYKTRFTQPFQTVRLEVPYETGIDPFDGLTDAAVVLGVLEKRGSRLAFVGEDQSFYAKDVVEGSELATKLLQQCESKTGIKLDALIGDDAEEDTTDSGPSTKAKRAAKKGVKK